MSKPITFDETFRFWLDNEVDQVEGRDLLPLAQEKGFSSITEWRLSAALRLGLDKLSWSLVTIDNPAATLPDVIVGPYKGWSIQGDTVFFDNQLNTTFAEAMEIPSFFEFCDTHERIQGILKNFPLPTTIILVERPDGRLIHIEGGHRIAAIAYANKIGQPIDFANKPPVSAAIAKIDAIHFEKLLLLAKQGTEKR